MKRYWLFIAPRYYPNSGMYDFYNSYNIIQEAQKVGIKISKSEDGQYINYYCPSDIYSHIWDSEEKRIIYNWDGMKWERFLPDENDRDIWRYEGSFTEPRL